MASPKVWQSSCLCGENVISWTGEPAFKFKCHCTDERKLTGAAFALNILYPDTDLRTVKGELVKFTKIVNSGNAMTSHLCSACGSLLYRSSTGYPGVFTIKAGCIDGKDMSEGFVPDVEIFTRSRVSWEKPIEGVKQEVADFTSLPGM